MQLFKFECPNCGGQITFPEEGNRTICNFCRYEIYLQEEVDKLQNDNASGIKELTDRIYDLIRQEEFSSVKEAAEEGLKKYPYSGRLHLCLLMAEYELTKPSMLGSLGKDYTSSINYQNCIRYMTTEDKQDLLKLVEQNKTVASPVKTIDEYEKIEVEKTPTAVEEFLAMKAAANSEIKETLEHGISQLKDELVNDENSQLFDVSKNKLGEIFDYVVKNHRDSADYKLASEGNVGKFKILMHNIRDDYISLAESDEDIDHIIKEKNNSVKQPQHKRDLYDVNSIDKIVAANNELKENNTIKEIVKNDSINSKTLDELYVLAEKMEETAQQIKTIIGEINKKSTQSKRNIDESSTTDDRKNDIGTKNKSRRLTSLFVVFLVIIFLTGLIMILLGHDMGNYILLISGVFDLLFAVFLIFVSNLRNK